MTIRNKFHTTNQNELNSLLSKGEEYENKNTKKRADEVLISKLKDGKYRFRIMPAHEDSKAYAYPFVISFIPGYSLKRDNNGQPVLKNNEYQYKQSRVPVFNSRVHGNTPKDIVEEYIKLAEKKIPENELDDDSAQDKLQNLRAFKEGIDYTVFYVMYVKEVYKGGTKSEPFILKVSKAQMKQLENIASLMDEEDEPLVSDPFTDPDTGRCVILDKDSSKDNKDKYQFNIDMAVEDGNKLKLFPLSDAELEDFLNYHSLEERFGSNVYSSNDFSKALEGLKLYDEEYDIGIFDTEDFQQIAEEINKYYKDNEENDEENNSDEEEDEDTPDKLEKAETDEEETDEEDEDEEDNSGNEELPLSNMDRNELKQYIKTNGYKIRVSKKMTDDDIRQRIKEEIQQSDLPWDQTDENDQSDEADEETPKTDIKSKLSKFKNK